ncbi:transposase [Myxococcus sp. CA040A]|uniref:transposase n=1 Tax=Myxococcus sp. CA040A TaxID=2741738 RepID=UPI00352EFEE0
MRALFLGAIRMTLEMLLEEEIRGLVGAGRWQQVAGRKDQRNGSYLRGLLTSMGHLEVRPSRSAGLRSTRARRSAGLEGRASTLEVPKTGGRGALSHAGRQKWTR